jgi:hypothetical protein
LCTSFAYRDKVVGVFVRFSCAAHLARAPMQKGELEVPGVQQYCAIDSYAHACRDIVSSFTVILNDTKRHHALIVQKMCGWCRYPRCVTLRNRSLCPYACHLE